MVYTFFGPRLTPCLWQVTIDGSLESHCSQRCFELLTFEPDIFFAEFCLSRVGASGCQSCQSLDPLSSVRPGVSPCEGHSIKLGSFESPCFKLCYEPKISRSFFVFAECRTSEGIVIDPIQRSAKIQARKAFGSPEDSRGQENTIRQ